MNPIYLYKINRSNGSDSLFLKSVNTDIFFTIPYWNWFGSSLACWLTKFWILENRSISSFGRHLILSHSYFDYADNPGLPDKWIHSNEGAFLICDPSSLIIILVKPVDVKSTWINVRFLLINSPKYNETSSCSLSPDLLSQKLFHDKLIYCNYRDSEIICKSFLTVFGLNYDQLKSK